MSYGLQLSASGAATALYRQDVYANNLANMDTAGFKPDVPMTYSRPAARQEDGLAYLPSNELLERLGGGALLRPNRVSLAQGSPRATGNALDVAVVGEGFLTVRDADGATRLTRDGRMTRDSSGRLVLAASGLPVLGADGGEIVLNGPGPVLIDGDGAIRVGGRPVARLNLVQPADPASLRKQGNSLFAVEGENTLTPATGQIRQNAYEESAVDEIAAILQVTSAARDVDSNISMMQQHDRLMDRAINVLGRVG